MKCAHGLLTRTLNPPHPLAKTDLETPYELKQTCSLFLPESNVGLSLDASLNWADGNHTGSLTLNFEKAATKKSWTVAYSAVNHVGNRLPVPVKDFTIYNYSL